VPLPDLNATLDFPLVHAAKTATEVTLERPGRSPLTIGRNVRSAGSFVLWSSPRDVVHVEARDLSGGRLTITQPTGTSFLSPVLLMQQRQTIAGLDVPFDSFAVPAAHRIVKAVLFSAAQAAMMRGFSAGALSPAVLFAVDDQDDRPLPHAIALARDGDAVTVGGLELRAAVLAYPAVEMASAPPLALVVIAGLLVLGGTVATARILSP
jgi:hypothetical protein